MFRSFNLTSNADIKTKPSLHKIPLYPQTGDATPTIRSDISSPEGSPFRQDSYHAIKAYRNLDKKRSMKNLGCRNNSMQKLLPPLTFDEEALDDLDEAFKSHLKNAENERLQKLNDSNFSTLPVLVKCASSTDSDKLFFLKSKKKEDHTLTKKDVQMKNSSPKIVTPIHSSPEIKESTNEITRNKNRLHEIEIKELGSYRPGRKPSKSLLINLSGIRTPTNERETIPIELLEITSKKKQPVLTKENSLLRLPI